jgi:penicillin-binding protein 1A
MRAPTLPPPLPQKAPRKRRRSFLLGSLGFWFSGVFLVFLVGSAVAGVIVWRASKDLPDYNILSKYTRMTVR